MNPLRIAAVAVLAIAVALFAGRVFGGVLPSLVVPALVPIAVLTAVGVARDRHPDGWLGSRWMLGLLAGLAVVVSMAVVAWIAGGHPVGDTVEALTSGPRRILTGEWPSPRRPDLIAMIGGIIAVAAGAACLLAMGSRFRAAPVAPLALVAVGVVAMSAPSPPGVVAVVLVVVAAVAAMMVGASESGAALRAVLADRSIVAMIALPVAVAVAMTLAVSDGDRADPRFDDPPSLVDTAVPPLEVLAGLREVEPPVEFYAVRGAEPADRYWRLGVLDEYDGRRWNPTIELRPIGPVLSPRGDQETDAYVITFLSDDLRLVPFPGAPVYVSDDVETDATRSVVRLEEQPIAGQVVSIEALPAVSFDAIANREPAARPAGDGEDTIGELDAVLDELADEATGQTDRLFRIAGAMRGWDLDSDVAGAGQQATLIERFATETRRGTREQFVATFVSYARSMGVDARIATGFDRSLVDGADDDGLTLTSRSMTAWPEIRFDPLGWVPFDPVPPNETSDETERPPPPQVQTPAAPQPPVVPPEEPDADQDDDPEVDDDAAAGGGVGVIGQVTVASAAVLLPLAAIVATILLIKLLRRRRRLGSEDSAARARGAWAEATDRLIDAGLVVGASATDGQIAGDGAAIAIGAGVELHELAMASSRASFQRRPDGSLDEFAASIPDHLTSVERAIAEPRSRWQRVRWRLSLRSLRRRTRTPVA